MRIILFSLILIDKSPSIASESPSRFRPREKPCHLEDNKKRSREKKPNQKNQNNFPIRTEIKELQQEKRFKKKGKSDQKQKRKLNLH